MIQQKKNQCKQVQSVQSVFKKIKKIIIQNMRTQSLIFLLFCFPFAVQSQIAPAKNTNAYAASKIPAALLTQQANVVFRESIQACDFTNPSKVVYSVRLVATILREDGKKWAHCQVGYNDKQSKITKFSGNLYDAKGKFIRKVKQSEIQDVATDDGISIATDSRSKITELMYGEYPFTVEFEYEIEAKGTVPVEHWEPQPEPTVSVEKSSFQIAFPTAETPRFKTYNLQKADPSVLQNSDGKSYQWTANDVVAYTENAYISNKAITSPTVFVSWNKFQYLGFSGDASSWATFGEFNNKLNEGRDKLPEAFKAEIRTLVKDCPTPLSKIEKIYEFLQKNTRYVSIQFGIGGLQPFPASEVCAKKYGDCKALSNFTKAMLQIVGIRSHYTTVGAGADAAPLQRDLVGHYSNHAFLCVPLEKDTIWLECTSQSEPAGYCGNFTGDRDVLISTETGGKVVHTPRYLAKDNREMRLATVKMDAEGNATTNVRTLYSGLKQDLPRALSTHGNEKEVRDFLIRNLKVSSVELKNFKYAADRQRIPTVEEKLSLELPHYGTRSGRRLFIQPNVFNKFSFEMPDTTTKKPRQFGVVASNMAYTDSDSLTFDLPEGFTIEHLPEAMSLKSVFGTYSTACRLDGKRLFYTRQLVLNNAEQPKETLSSLLDFMREVEKADKMKVVLVASAK
jgi:predicted Zn-ribbon and HTH transcriptional regulator